VIGAAAATQNRDRGKPPDTAFGYALTEQVLCQPPNGTSGDLPKHRDFPTSTVTATGWGENPELTPGESFCRAFCISINLNKGKIL
jgi:hypothetical protein